MKRPKRMNDIADEKLYCLRGRSETLLLPAPDEILPRNALAKSPRHACLVLPAFAVFFWDKTFCGFNSCFRCQTLEIYIFHKLETLYTGRGKFQNIVWQLSKSKKKTNNKKTTDEIICCFKYKNRFLSYLARFFLLHLISFPKNDFSNLRISLLMVRFFGKN